MVSRPRQAEPDRVEEVLSGTRADLSLSSQVAAGGLWSLGGQAATLVATLVATPFTLRLLGPAFYGLWALLQVALQWVVLADLGMATASTRLVAQRYAQ